MIKRSDNVNIEICTVVFSKEHLDYLKSNVRLTKKMNPKTLVKWIVVDNSGGKVKFPKGNLFTLVRGASLSLSKKRAGSFHHGEGLNIGIKRSKTRFLLILDPDFFIVSRNWVEEVIQYMKEEELALLGVPWHPRWYSKVRYFPSPHCFFIDTRTISRDKINFLPKDFNKVFPIKFLSVDTNLILRILYGVFRAITLKDRASIGVSKDTAIRMYEKHKNRTDVRLFTPVFKIDRQFRGPNYAKSWINKLIERLLPEKLCFVPKNRNSFSEVEFNSREYKEINKLEYEQFLWNSKPFGFHIRGVSRNKKISSVTRDIELIKRLISDM